MRASFKEKWHRKWEWCWVTAFYFCFCLALFFPLVCRVEVLSVASDIERLLLSFSFLIEFEKKLAKFFFSFFSLFLIIDAEVFSPSGASATTSAASCTHAQLNVFECVCCLKWFKWKTTIATWSQVLHAVQSEVSTTEWLGTDENSDVFRRLLLLFVGVKTFEKKTHLLMWLSKTLSPSPHPGEDDYVTNERVSEANSCERIAEATRRLIILIRISRCIIASSWNHDVSDHATNDPQSVQRIVKSFNDSGKQSNGIDDNTKSRKHLLKTSVLARQHKAPNGISNFIGKIDKKSIGMAEEGTKASNC